MSIGNDITLCPLCHGAKGNMECPICEGEGITFTWMVDEYWEKQSKLLKEKDKFVRLDEV